MMAIDMADVGLGPTKGEAVEVGMIGHQTSLLDIDLRIQRSKLP